MEMFLALLPIVYIFLSLFVLRECFLPTETYFDCKVINIIIFEKHFLNSTTDTQSYLLYQKLFCISEPIFYGDLVYKFKRIVGKPNFSDEFKTIIKRCKKLDITCISCDSLHVWL